MRIADIQHDIYWESLSAILTKARMEYLRAESVLGIHTELGKFFDKEKFDHRTLQWFHDAIAGQFRLIYCLKADMFEQPPNHSDEVNSVMVLWRQFLDDELNRLFMKWSELPRQIGTAAFLANPDSRGMAAEERLYEITLMEYADLDLEPGNQNV